MATSTHTPDVKIQVRRKHSTCGYILDFACIGLKLAIELDGGQHANNIEAGEMRTKVLN